MRTRWWVVGLAVGGLLIMGSVAWHLIVLDGTASLLHRVIDLVLIGGSGIGFLYGSYWHVTRPFDSERYPRIVAWIVGTGLLFVGLGVISLFIGSEQVTSIELIEVCHLTGAIGLLAGVLVGTMHAQAITNAEVAARAEAEAEALTAEQERIEELTDLLRHYILNGVNIISGYAAQLQSKIADEDQHALDMIDNRAQMMATLIEHIRSVQRVDQSSPSTIELAEAVASATANVQSTADATIETPNDPPVVHIDRQVKEALSLLCKAILTTTTSDGRLAIDCSLVNRTVTITLTAVPAELPDPIAEGLFEPIGSGIGLEFHLAKQIFPESTDLRLVENTGEKLQFEIAVPVEDQQ